MLDPLLAVPPALAGIGAASVRRPLAYGGLSLVAAVIVALKPTEFAGWLPVTTIFTVVVITVVATAGTALNVRQERRIADVTSVAEAAQRALLRPPPPRLGPLGFDVVYLAAAAEAKVGGDLYEVTRTGDHGIRVIIGDVRGKGLGAIELASDVLGMFRELAHDAATLGELAARLDAGLGRGMGRHEEFVTALLVEIDPESGRTLLFNCGHPAPMLISAATDDAVTGCVSLRGGAGARRRRSACSPSATPPPRSFPCPAAEGPAAPLHRRRYRGARRQAGLLPAARAHHRPRAPGGGRRRARRRRQRERRPSRRGLLNLIHADLVKHVGAPLNDDAALLLIRAPAAWPAARPPHPPPG